ncbi:hypothetical protein F5141DRAFT_1129519 [Pisolithus sp. B1]|nr:hypothetical protein F5141DRAFT_1129519 [Pisolithus sp. B1]
MSSDRSHGLEGIYRNRQADVQRFLSARHGQDFWVFNFCPIMENSYDESVLDGRVSRYPFPDHNAALHSSFLMQFVRFVTRERISAFHRSFTCRR